MRIFDNKKKKAIMIASMVTALIIASVVVVYAVVYITDKDGPANSVFTPSEVGCSVAENEGTYTVTNEGNINSYIRVAVVANWKNIEGIHWQVPEITVTPDSTWVKEGDYYYFKGAVVPDATVTFGTVALSGETVDGYDLQIQVLAEAIQSQPDGAVQDAWDMTFDGSNWNK